MPATRIRRNATRPRREILLTSGLDIHPASSTHFVAEQKYIRLDMQPGELPRRTGCITRLFPVNDVRWRVIESTKSCIVKKTSTFEFFGL